MTTVTRIAVRRDTTANWAAANPVLAPGEPAVDTDTGVVRFGDGVRAYLDLPTGDVQAVKLIAERGVADAATAFNRAVSAESAAKADTTAKIAGVTTLANSKYVLPTGGIPATDLATAVRDSLSRADSALQQAPVTSVAGKQGAVTLTQNDVGLNAVDNTADTDKPVSIAQRAYTDAKYTKPSDGIPETDLSTSVQQKLNATGGGGGGGTVDQTARDSAAAAQSTADSKYAKPSTGIPKTDLASSVQTTLDKADSALQSAPVTSVAGRTGAVTVSKSDVGLANVDNTSDANKPVSTAQAAADTTTLNSAKTYTDGKFTDTGWLNVTLNNTASYTSSVQVRVKNGLVVMRGALTINSGAIATVSAILTLPSGARPAAAGAYLAIGTGTIAGRVTVNTNGTINIDTPNGSTATLRFEQVTFFND